MKKHTLMNYCIFKLLFESNREKFIYALNYHSSKNGGSVVNNVLDNQLQFDPLPLRSFG